ncbi:MAG: aldo/keto reductase [Clostridia bacterium]|nr:aldo/keto reductase [Clostridia bacterium]
MKEITLGKSKITTCQNAFGALPIQRVSDVEAVKILHRAYEGGMRFFDTARDYTDSEHKVGLAFSHMRDKVFIASKTIAKTPEKFWEDLETSLSMLKTDYLDLYQLHCVDKCYREDDDLYQCLLEAKRQGKIRHIGITAHKLGVAEEIAESGLYEVLQYPFSYLSSDREIELVKTCEKNDVGFLAMKGLAGGLITNSKAAMAFMTDYNVLPIWGVQRMSELEEWLSYMEDTPTMDEEITEFIEEERKALDGEFCRGCGYCMPCPMGIQINQCARIHLMIRRAPAEGWLGEYWQKEMENTKNCTGCGQCIEKCPYSLPVPDLLKENYEDYIDVLKGAAK